MAQALVTFPADLPTLTADGPTPSFDPAADAAAELRRQADAYAALGVTAALGLTDDDVVGWATSPAATSLPASTEHDDHVPLVLVLPHAPGQVDDVVPAMRRGPRHGVSVIDPQEAAGYLPLEDATPPPGAYVLTDVDVGGEFRDVTPEDALAEIRRRGRTPLTMTEGVALVVVRPDMLRPNRCFSTPGSRTPGNQRVPAVWISDRRPKLGWCWDRNPHTWLGVAHAAARVPLG